MERVEFSSWVSRCLHVFRLILRLILGVCTFVCVCATIMVIFPLALFMTEYACHEIK